MYYIFLTAFAMLIPLIFLIDGINSLKRKNDKYDGETTAIVENIEITQRLQEPKVKTLFISYKYYVDDVEYHSKENLLNKDNADVGLYENAEELGLKLGIPINSKIVIKYNKTNPSKSVYDLEWKKHTESIGGTMGLILGGSLTLVLLIIEILLIWNYIMQKISAM